MTSSESPAAPSSLAFPSINSLRRAHTELLRRQRPDSGNAVTADEVATFIRRARATGKVLAAEDSRDTAQGILDYWYGSVVVANRDMAASIGSLNLDEFDVANETAPPEDAQETEARTQARTQASILAAIRTFDSGLPESSRPLLRRLLLRLFLLNKASGTPFRSQLPQTDDVFSMPEASKLAESMLKAGLLKTETTGTGESTAYVLEDDLLFTEWPDLSKLVTERHSLREATNAWDKAGRPDELLMDEGTLLTQVYDYKELLAPEEKDFVTKSWERSLKKAEERQSAKTRAIVVLSVLACVLLVLVFVLVGSKAKDTLLIAKQDKLIEQQRTLDLLNKQEADRVKLDKEKAEKSVNELLLQLDEKTKAADKLTELTASWSAAAKSITDFRNSIQPRLTLQEREALDAAIAKLTVSQDQGAKALQLAETSETTAKQLLVNKGLDAVETKPVTLSPPVLVKVLEGHQKDITAVTFSSDGRLATAGEDNLVRIWNAAGEKQTPDIQGSARDGVSSLAFSPDGKRLAIGSQGSSVRLHEFSTGNTRAFEGHSDAITSVTFSPNGKSLLSTSRDKSVQLWRADDLQVIFNIRDLRAVPSRASFNTAGNRVVAALGYPANTALVWDGLTSAAKLELPADSPVRNATFSPDGSLIVTANSKDNMAVIWDAVTGKMVKRLVGHLGPVYQAIFDPAGTQVATASGDGTVNLWRVEDGALITTLIGHSGEVRLLAFSPSGKVLLTGSLDKTARLWYEGESEARYTLTGHTGPLTSMAFNHDGSQIATGSQDSTVRLWSFKDEPKTQAATKGWTLFGWLDTASEQPKLRFQSYSSTTSGPGDIPKVGDIVTAEAFMNIRDQISLDADAKRWNQGKRIGQLPKGEKVKITDVKWQKGIQPATVWIQFEKP